MNCQDHNVWQQQETDEWNRIGGRWYADVYKGNVFGFPVRMLVTPTGGCATKEDAELELAKWLLTNQ